MRFRWGLQCEHRAVPPFAEDAKDGAPMKFVVQASYNPTASAAADEMWAPRFSGHGD